MNPTLCIIGALALSALAFHSSFNSKKEFTPLHRLGQQRTRTYFAWSYVHIFTRDGSGELVRDESRWLRFVTVLEQYSLMFDETSIYGNTGCYGWKPIAFIDSPEAVAK